MKVRGATGRLVARAQDGLPATAFGVVFFAMIYLQKVGVTFGERGVGLALIAFYGVVAWLAVAGRLTISPTRLLAYAIFATAAVLSQLLSGRDFSAPSILFVLLLYLPFVLQWSMSRERWLGIVDIFQDMMLPAAGMVFAQLIWQLVFHGRALSLDALLPSAIKLTGFMYEAPIKWGQPLMRPNGFFFLEPSFVSAFCACALVLEASARQRLWRLVWYGGALVASTGATGLVLAAVAAPFVLLRQRPAFIVGVLVLAGLALMAAVGTGAGTRLVLRLNELGDVDSSGFGRLVAPLLIFGDVASRPWAVFTGSGAGTIDTAMTQQASAWPVVKLAVEYGFVTAIAFMAMIVMAMWRAPVTGLAVGLFVVFNFTGGYLLSPVLPLLMLTLATTIRLTPPSTAPRRVAAVRWAAA